MALYPYEDLVQDVSEAFTATNGKFTGFTLAHNVRTREEVDAVFKQAEAGRAKIENRGQDAFLGGYSSYFFDPDGHFWEVAWGPFGFREDESLIVT